MVARNRFEERFRLLKSEGRTGLFLYLTAGYPDMEATRQLVPALVAAGADCIELGVPFTDPLADGVTIQASSAVALRNGVTLESCIAIVRELRSQVPDTPLLLMGYYNPLLSYGLEKFGRDARVAGLDAVIVADLPPDESGPLFDVCRPNGIHVIPLLAPTSIDARIAMGCREASGFVYCVSLTGVTGARSDLPSGVFGLLERVRKHTTLPLAVGFGVSRREHVEALSGKAEAVVVGSALIRVLMDSPRDELVERASRYVRELTGAVPSLPGGRQ